MDDKIMLRRLDFALRLRLLAPLHVGSGDRRIVDARSDEDGPTQIALILRDAEGRPWIPAASVKGVLRSLSTRAIEVLFGAISDHDEGTGRMGALLFRAAVLHTPGDAVGSAAATDGTFIHQRTALDPGRGIAKRNRLFAKEMVAPGALFALRIRLEKRSDAAEFQDLTDAVIDLLSAFGGREGVGLGAGSADGQGRLRLEGEIDLASWLTDATTGALVPGKSRRVPARPIAAPPPFARLRCHSEMPFLIADSAWQRPADDDKAPHIKGLRRRSKDRETPFVTGSSVSGALRARAEWLDRLAASRSAWTSGTAPPPPPTDTAKVATATDLASLGPVDWLFGAIGARGRLRVAVSEAKGKPATVTSVRIDRFTGAPIENALFATEGDLGTSFDLVLSLDEVGPAAGALAEALKQDLLRNGLKLGHATNRGFGWFKVEEIADERA